MDVTGYRYRDCRLIGHSWHEVDSNHWSATVGVPMTLRCERCDMERRDQVGRNDGEVVARSYRQPYAYAWDKGVDDDSPRRVDFRLAWLQDHIAKTRADKRARRTAQ